MTAALSTSLLGVVAVRDAGTLAGSGRAQVLLTARSVTVTGAVLCVATLGVVASTLRRMDLCVEAFGLTRLRLFVEVVEVVLAVILVLVLISGLRWRARWFPRAVVQVMRWRCAASPRSTRMRRSPGTTPQRSRARRQTSPTCMAFRPTALPA